MHICTIQSCEVPQFEGSDLRMGVYESNVTVNLKKARLSGDPKGYVQHQISTHLAGCVKSTAIPLGERAWGIIFTHSAMQMFNFPARTKV